uniref:Uncharacterized protein n=1 Tax=Xiphophorus couchianus TaxID=32473 RepID=A0A3B5LYV7_9TELE
ENVFIESSRSKYMEDLHTEALEGLKMMQEEASTFRPLNSGKKSEKSKTRKRQRRSVAGIPRHVQKEFEQLFNRDTDNSPSTVGPESPEELGSIPQTSNIIHPLSKEKVAQLNAAHAAHKDDLALLHRFTPHSEDERRPRSVAVPWMTTASSLQQKPPSPVMTMSPQAAYMSKIIPNAVLPPSVDVVEISRSRSRSSVRMVSKSSLLVTTSSNITSVSRYNGPTLSDTSCYSNSDSSETLVSDSSTISSNSRQKMPHNVDTSAKHYKVNSNYSNGTFNTKVLIKGEQKDGQFVRSLSVIKSKRAPPPPSRSYSLHSKMKRRSQDLVELPIEPSAPSKEKENHKPGSSPLPSSCVDSPGYHGDTSSLDDSTGSTLFHTRLLSPSSGYSSQDGTSPQQPPSTSPKHKKGFFTKLQKLFSGPNSSSLAPGVSTQTEIAEPKHDTVSVSPSVQTLRELFNIPPPPKVHAPPPPPPEVWAHSKQSSVSASPVKEVHLPTAVEVSKDFTLQHTQETSYSTEQAGPLRKYVPPQSIPPLPPQLQPSEQEIDPPDKSAPPKPETKELPNSILIPHQCIPPSPPKEPLLKSSTDHSGTDEAPILPPSEFRNASLLKEEEEIASTQPINIPLPPPLPAQIPADSNHKYGPLSIENQHQTTACASDVHREQSNVITPSLLKMVKLRSVENKLPTSSSTSEAPQKPIRKSLIMTYPTSTSPPSVVVSTATSPTVVAPMKESPPATTSSAARSKQGPSSRLSPLSPLDYLKSPTSTASFIFSKSNKKVVIETKQKQEEKENVQNNEEDSTKVTSEGESKIAGRVPPPVAKKPKAKGKEAETSDAVEQTEINGTAGTVQSGTSSA